MHVEDPDGFVVELAVEIPRQPSEGRRSEGLSGRGREAEDAPTEDHAAGNGRYRLMGQLVEVISRLRRG